MTFEEVVRSEVENTKKEDAAICATRMRVISRRINLPIVVVGIGDVGCYERLDLSDSKVGTVYIRKIYSNFGYPFCQSTREILSQTVVHVRWTVDPIVKFLLSE